MSTKKLNLFVEDPGSSNFAFNLEKLLEKQKIDIKIYASGISKSYLSTYKQSFIDYDLVKRIDYKCDFFIFGTSENKESPVKKIFKEAKKYNVKTGIIIDAPNSIFERLKSFEIDCYYENVDYFFVTDNKTKKELLKKKIIKANKILDVLNPKFQWIKDQKLQKKQKKKKKNYFSK